MGSAINYMGVVRLRILQCKGFADLFGVVSVIAENAGFDVRNCVGTALAGQVDLAGKIGKESARIRFLLREGAAQ